MKGGHQKNDVDHQICIRLYLGSCGERRRRKVERPRGQVYVNSDEADYTDHEYGYKENKKPEDLPVRGN
jgi:hypothetical protein